MLTAGGIASVLSGDRMFYGIGGDRNICSRVVAECCGCRAHAFIIKPTFHLLMVSHQRRVQYRINSLSSNAYQRREYLNIAALAPYRDCI